MNDEQIIAEICQRLGLNKFTLPMLDDLTRLCRAYYQNRMFVEENNTYINKSE